MIHITRVFKYIERAVIGTNWDECQREIMQEARVLGFVLGDVV
jgi:hypothetical protein